MIILTDQELMQVAIDEAIKGLKIGDQPFGSVIVIDDEIVSIGRNKINSSFDITAHAEILAIKKASKEKKIIDFSEATIYATWEPCPMCLGAIISANISKLVIAGRPEKHNKKYGNYSVEKFLELSNFSEKIEVVTGVLENESKSIVKKWTNKK